MIMDDTQSFRVTTAQAAAAVALVLSQDCWQTRQLQLLDPQHCCCSSCCGAISQMCTGRVCRAGCCWFTGQGKLKDWSASFLASLPRPGSATATTKPSNPFRHVEMLHRFNFLWGQLQDKRPDSWWHFGVGI